LLWYLLSKQKETERICSFVAMIHHNTDERYLPIEDYGIIGNLHTVALVSLQASIDFMSFSRFDAPTVFCKLLDADKGGFYSIMPQMKNMVTKQLYLPDTNVLVTRFFADEGIAEIIDYMPVDKNSYDCAVIRKVTTVRGMVKYDLRCAPRFNYARSKHTVQKKGDSCVFIPEEEQQPVLLLSSDQELSIEDTDVIATFQLKEDEVTCFVLEDEGNQKSRTGNLDEYVQHSYKHTINFWQHWIAKGHYNGHWEEVVRRSALTLKLLISQKYGSIIAAPTFSLPEEIGGTRNWDYRYTWIRDAAFSMHAFLQLGFLEEAEQFLEWVKKQSSQNELQLMFDIDGSTDLEEYTLDHLEGYKGSKPVRVGNDAHRQTQMDIYGELLETLYIFCVHGGDITYDYWKIIEQYIEYVINNWHKPDHSIWEVRGIKREFLFSRLMCWVAMDRAIKIAQHFSFPYDILKWHNIRDQIFEDIYHNFWNEEKQSFVQYKESDNIDSSALLMPILNIISPNAERWQKTMTAIDRELRSDVLVYRYRETKNEVDGLKGKEGTFTMCSFWHVECLALQGEVEKAREHFEKMLGYANHLGLFSEQLGMRGEHLGNFPQAFTHLALISAAIELSNSKKQTVPYMDNTRREMK
jgi:GH15 family glucan-1,4-alpha-glucosidase